MHIMWAKKMLCLCRNLRLERGRRLILILNLTQKKHPAVEVEGECVGLIVGVRDVVAINNIIVGCKKTIYVKAASASLTKTVTPPPPREGKVADVAIIRAACIGIKYALRCF
jgi:hypothetical protein